MDGGGTHVIDHGVQGRKGGGREGGSPPSGTREETQGGWIRGSFFPPDPGTGGGTWSERNPRESRTKGGIPNGRAPETQPGDTELGLVPVDFTRSKAQGWVRSPNRHEGWGFEPSSQDDPKWMRWNPRPQTRPAHPEWYTEGRTG